MSIFFFFFELYEGTRENTKFVQLVDKILQFSKLQNIFQPVFIQTRCLGTKNAHGINRERKGG